MRDAHRDTRIGLVLVGFSPPDRLAALARHFAWPGQVLADPNRVLYQRLRIRRAPVWRVYNPGTLARYAAALRRRERVEKAVEDTRQLGGDAIVVDTNVVLLWRPHSPDDRPAASTVLSAAQQHLR